MRLSNQKLLLLNVFIMAILLAHSVNRDIQLEKMYPGDLRNRVVGARLQKDGVPPYTYRWKPSDGMRYYDPDSNPALQTKSDSLPNSITASPFFHELLRPICELPQRSFSIVWLCLQYVFLAVIIGIFVSLTDHRLMKWAIVDFSILFTWTEAWKGQIGGGQIYLFNAVVMALTFYCLTKNKKYGFPLAGLFAAAFVLCRPIAIVLFIPFLFYFRQYRMFLITAAGGLIIYMVFVWLSPLETAIYRDYYKSMKMHIALHQSDNPDAELRSNTKFELYKQIEGFDMDSAHQQEVSHPIKVYDENGNVFVLYNLLTHKKMPIAWMNGLMVLTLLILSFLFFMTSRKYPIGLERLALFGFTLYMIVEIFSPVHRHQYNTAQWLPMLLICFMPLPAGKRLAFSLIFLGLFLNIVNFPWLYMRHTIGECCWILAIGLLVFGHQVGRKHSARSQ